MRAFTCSRLAWREIAPFGIELDCDLSKPLSPDERGAFRELFYRHGLIVCRGQKLSVEEQIEVMSVIGTVPRSVDNVALVSSDLEKGFLGTQALPFHSDQAYTLSPQRAASLHPVELTDGASSTLFASALHAYRALSAELRLRIDGLTAIQAYTHYIESESVIGLELTENMPQARHPVVLPHPVTGQPVLFVMHQDTICFDGLQREDGIALAKALFEVLYAPANVYEHIWHMGDFVIWDNIALQHSRGNVEHAGRRILSRVGVNEKSLADNSRIDLSDKNTKAFIDNSFTRDAKKDAVQL